MGWIHVTGRGAAGVTFRWLVGLVVAIGLAEGAGAQTKPGAQKPGAQSKPASLDEILTRIKQSDPKMVSPAEADLDGFLEGTVSGADLLKLIATAPGLPEREGSLGGPQRRVIEAVTDKPRAELLGPLEAVFERLAAEAQERVIEYHLEVGTEAGKGWFKERFTKDVGKHGWSRHLATMMLEKLPAEEAGGMLMLALAREKSAEFGVAGLLDGVEDGKVPERLVAKNLQGISEAFGPWLKKLDVKAAMARSKPPEDYRWEEQYRDAVAVAEYFPDLLGHGGKGAEGILRESLAAKAPRVSLFAIRSLVKLGLAVPAEDVGLVAAEDETRNKLYDYLKEAGRAKEFPEKFRTQEAFARSEMVEWLIYPTELDRAPNEIEMMREVEAQTPEGVEVVYLFRFRTKDEPWRAGIAGGYKQADVPTTASTGLTFSSFDKWDSKTPEEHVAGIRKTIEEAWKEKAGK